MRVPPFRLWKGRRVRSEDEGPEQAARKVPGAPRSGSLFFVPSPLEGWGLETLILRLPADAVVVVYEQDDELRLAAAPALQAWLGDQAADPRLFVLARDREADVADLFRRLPLGRLRRVEFLTLNGAWLAHAGRYRAIFRRLEDGLNRWWSNRMTELHLGPLWVRNLFDNLAAGRVPGSAWPDWGHDPVAVVGAGPSLDTWEPWLRRHRAGWRLVAVDTALGALGDWGVVPDAVVSLESQLANLDDFAAWQGAPVHLFADLTSLPAVGRVLGGDPTWFVTEFSPLALWDRWPALPPRLPPLGSVGLAATEIAWRLSRGPVLVVGLDFSFPPGRSHARGSPALKASSRRHGRLHPEAGLGLWARPGLVEGPRPGWLSSPVLRGYRDLLAQRAQAHAARTWVWPASADLLGLEPWADLEAGPPLAALPPPVRAPWTPADLLSRERRLWDRLADDLATLRPAVPWPELQSQLLALDYLTFAFPDPEPRQADEWLVRARQQVLWARSRWPEGGLSPRRPF